jgi:signal recognition particle GTPase
MTNSAIKAEVKPHEICWCRRHDGQTRSTPRGRLTIRSHRRGAMSKLDGDTARRGAFGGAVRKAFKFAAPARTRTLEPFYPDRMPSRIWGWATCQLIEKAQKSLTKRAAELEKKLRSNKMTHTTFRTPNAVIAGSLSDMRGMSRR